MLNVSQCFIVISIFGFLMVSKVEYLFMYLWAISLSSSQKCLLTSFSHLRLQFFRFFFFSSFWNSIYSEFLSLIRYLMRKSFHTASCWLFIRLILGVVCVILNVYLFFKCRNAMIALGYGCHFSPHLFSSADVVLWSFQFYLLNIIISQLGFWCKFFHISIKSKLTF